MSSSSACFNSPDADVVLICNGESTEFHVHRCILSIASPFFRAMFTLPQDSKQAEGKPVIPVSEPPHVLDSLLRLVYPMQDPCINSLDALSTLLACAIKYEFVPAIATLRKLLVSPEYTETAPVRVYAIACQFDLEHEASVASRCTLCVNVLDSPILDDLKHVSAHAYHRLLTLHRTRGRAAQALLQIPEEIKCMQCNGSAFTMHGSPKWWHEFVKRARGELAVRPITDVIFDPGYLAEVAEATGCVRCPGSVLNSWTFLRDLRAAIDSLPASLEMSRCGS